MNAEPTARRLKVACVTCYFDPDYVRSRTIRAALQANPNVALTIIKNQSRGSARYWQVIRQVWRVKRQVKPDIWLLNFRGYELLPYMVAIAGRTPIIYDEFVNPVLVTNEHRLQKRGLVKALMGGWQLLGWFYYALLKRCTLILADTEPHGRHAAQLGGLDPARYRALPVGVDETVFDVAKPALTATDTFQVFFYSTGVQPLHGTQYVLKAAEMLKDDPRISFLISGNRGNLAQRVRAAMDRGARITHRDWIPFEELPSMIRGSGVCLGGPFGDTQQAQMVITTKTYQFIACAAPTIVGRSPVTAVFQDKQNALVVPQADAAALADAIRWAAAHRKQLAAIGLAGRQLYEQQFSQASITEQMADVIEVVRRQSNL